MSGTVDVRLTWVKGSRTRLTDGTNRYWPDGLRWRWARIAWPDDGWGVPGHGAADSLLLAVESAYSAGQLRAEVVG